MPDALIVNKPVELVTIALPAVFWIRFAPVRVSEVAVLRAESVLIVRLANVRVAPPAAELESIVTRS